MCQQLLGGGCWRVTLPQSTLSGLLMKAEEPQSDSQDETQSDTQDDASSRDGSFEGNITAQFLEPPDVSMGIPTWCRTSSGGEEQSGGARAR